MNDNRRDRLSLGQVVGINEEIKRVIEISFRVNLMALNAILLARRAGAAARGFGILSNELREFIHGLEGVMRGLQGLTSETVIAVSEDARRRRIQRITARALEEVRARKAETGKRLLEVIDSQTRWSERREARLAGLGRSLHLALSDADELVRFGDVLARTAKVEAAYGGNFTSSLSQVATDFGNTIQDITRCLAELRRRNGGQS